MSENNYRITDRPLFLLRYIVQHTNDDHKVSLADLIAYCEQHGHSGSRHAISNDIDILNRYGFDIICTKEGNKNFYSYGSRLLETAELRMLIDAVAAAPFLTAHHTACLTQKLASIAGLYDAEQLCATVSASNQSKSDNGRIFLSIDIIHQAIAASKKISFQYAAYNGQHNREPRFSEEIGFSPYSTIWRTDWYYVVGWSDSESAIRAYRLDKMQIPCFVDAEAVKKPLDFHPADYVESYLSHANVYQKTAVTLECENSMMNHVIDQFGEHFLYRQIDNTHFQATIPVKLTRSFWGWIFEHVGSIRIAAPESVQTQYRNMLRRALESIN